MTLQQAIEFRKSGFFREAKEILEYLIENGATEGAIHYHLGVTLGRLGDHRGAVDSYRTAIELGLDDATERLAILGCAATLRARGRFFEAARELRRGLERRPDDDALRAMLALCLNKLGMHDDALHTAMQLLLSTTSSPQIREHAHLLSIYVDELVDRDDDASEQYIPYGKRYYRS
jgi:Flp pilus assembly protein TadD